VTGQEHEFEPIADLVDAILDGNSGHKMGAPVAEPAGNLGIWYPRCKAGASANLGNRTVKLGLGSRPNLC
jgi:hypothetical protein